MGDALPDDATLAALADLMLAVADAEILPRFRRLKQDEVDTKSSATDLVTIADTAAERVLSAELRRRFPDAVLIGEEAVSADPALLDLMCGAHRVITIDPVDGTRNFAAGLPAFAVMLGLLIDGEPAAGVIVDPLARDASIAAHGRGAWLRRADGSRERLSVRPARPVAQMEVCGGWNNLPGPDRAELAQRLTRFAANANYRCSGQESRMVAAGQYDAAFYAKLTPWDHVPCVTLIREAGGHSAHLDGTPYDPNRRHGGLLHAVSPEAWDDVRDVLNG